MVKKGGKGEKSQPPANAEDEERKRLRSLAFSKKLLSRDPSKFNYPLQPSKTVVKHQGRDIVKKGQRKNRFLFSFPGLLAPISSGKIGELSDLGTKNPVLYLDFPQGRMKLFGTIVYPKNKYLTLQFARSSKSVMCEDSFENMIVFSDAWWIGTKEENPEELQLEFPKELNEGTGSEYDFKGGAGGTVGEKLGYNNPRKECGAPLSPDTELKDDKSEDSGPLTEINIKPVTETTPVRQSARTVGKALNYAEPSSADDSISGDTDEHIMMVDTVDDKIDDTTSSGPDKAVGSSLKMTSTCSSDKEYADMKTLSRRKAEPPSLSMKESKEETLNKRGTMVQATLSALFDKVVKKSKSSAGKSPEPKGSSHTRELSSTKQRTGSVKTEGLSTKEVQSKGKNIGREAATRRKQFQVQDDDVEEISSESQGQVQDDDVEEISSQSQGQDVDDDSDEDWAV